MLRSPLVLLPPPEDMQLQVNPKRSIAVRFGARCRERLLMSS